MLRFGLTLAGKILKIANGSKAPMFRGASALRNSILMKIKGKPTFEIEQTGGFWDITNLRTGTVVTPSYSSMPFKNKVTLSTIVEFDKKSAASRLMGLKCMTKRYDYETGNYIDTKYVFNNGYRCTGNAKDMRSYLREICNYNNK